MKTAREILNKKMNWDTGFPLNEPERMYIISSMEEYAEQMVNEYSNWLWEMDRLKLTNQLPPFETPEAMTEHFLKAKIRPLQECLRNSEHLLNIPCVSNSVCGMPNCQKEVHRLGYCLKHYKLFMKYPAY